MKRTVKMLALLAVLCLTVGGYALVQNMNQETSTVSESEGTFALSAHTADELTGLQYTKSDVTYHFVKTDDAWQLADNTAFPLDSDAVQTMADNLSDLVATRKLTDGVTLADYGLDEPEFTVTATWSDGTTSTYAMGDATPFSDGYYVYLTEDAATVYTTSSSLSSLFTKTMATLTVKETIPAAEEQVTRMTLGNVLDITYLAESPTLDPDQHWVDTATGTPLDGSAVESLIEVANALSFSDVSIAAPSQQELEDAQLTQDTATVLTLYVGDEAVRTLWIGAAEDSSYDATLPDSTIIYTMSSTNVDKLLSASVESLTADVMMPLTYENLAQAEFSGEGVAYTLAPQTESAEDAEATDGETADSTDDAGAALWAQVTGLSWQDATESKDGELLLTIRVESVNGRSETLTFSTYDVDHYQVSADGSEAKLVSADSVDKLIRTLKSMK